MITIILLVLILILLGYMIFRSRKETYLYASSTNDQIVASGQEGQPQVVRLDIIDSASGINWSQGDQTLTIPETGVYFLMASVQTGTRLPGSAASLSDVLFWFEQNGEAIPDAGNWVQPTAQSPSYDLVNHLVSRFKKGDKIGCKFSSSAPQYGLIAFPLRGNAPTAPGITLSIFKIGN